MNDADITVAVQTGTTSDLYAIDNLALAEIKGYTGFDEAVLALKNEGGFISFSKVDLDVHVDLVADAVYCDVLFALDLERVLAQSRRRFEDYGFNCTNRGLKRISLLKRRYHVNSKS